ncbi:tyrosinase family protein [Frateuria sp. STR12]|uniref:tyrosinase family protein n=1 Tax=Frateuria hangzhouensis TaxID=2995589 RepID=UPI002260DAFD|nr:tyrosinase family protein [Frateuria sp. STR12]MCX7513946.1 tyrosinase family protein [Frateuria sp. STR12]
MISRRRFVQSSMTAALIPLLPKAVLTASAAGSGDTPAIRQSWEEFAQGPHLQPFIDAIGSMRDNKDETDPNSWYYWIKTHQDHCPHRKPYFLAWHRGLLKRFEGRLRRVSGIADFQLPYWNYYANPQVPAAFLVDHSPLWRNKRTSSDVTDALSLAPFADDVTNFERGLEDAFEPTLETAPHNPVHNLIGGAMSNITFSPADPLFYVHHANIDRLWAAWSAAGNGREMPPENDPYWQGDNLDYGPAIRSMPKVWTYSTTSTFLGYAYDDETMPASLPSYPASMARPASQPVQLLSPAHLDATTKQLGGTGQFALDEQSTTFDIPMPASSANHIRSLMIGKSSATRNGGPLELVLENVRLTGLGEEGGFFYKVFLNLPASGSAIRRERDYLLGMIGPFEISVAQMSARMAAGKPMHGSMDAHAKGPVQATMRFPVMESLRRIWPANLDKLSVSLVRVGRQGRAGRVIVVDRMRLEASEPR